MALHSKNVRAFLFLVMSRSVRKTKICGVTNASSEKKDKQDANRKYRRILKILLNKEAEKLPHLREVSNTWTFRKDGKKYNPTLTLRK